MQWYYSKNGAQQGPVSLEELKSKVASGEVLAGDLAWNEGMTDWLPVSQIPELAGGGAPAGEVVAPGASAGPVPGGQLQQPGAMQVPGAPPLGSGKATASMVLGICSLPGACFPCLGLILGILAIVFGGQVQSMALTNPDLKPFEGKAKAGKIMGIIAIVLSVLNGIAGVIIQANNGGFNM